MRPVSLGERVLCRQESLCGRAVSLSFRVLLEGVRHRDGPVAEVLAVHGLDGGIGRVEAGEIDESITLGVAGVGISHDLWRLEDHAEGTECVVEQFLVNLWVQVTDEDVCAHIQVFVVRRGLINSNWFAIQLDHIHDFDGIVGIFLTKKLHKAITLMLSSDPVFGHVSVDYRASLQEKLP